MPADPTSSNEPKPTTEGTCSLPAAGQQDGGEHVKQSFPQCGYTVSCNDSDSAGSLCWLVGFTNFLCGNMIFAIPMVTIVTSTMVIVCRGRVG